MDDNVILQLRGICKSFGDLHANIDIDLDVIKGSVHAIVGENGAGKSTLMNIVAGIHNPDHGHIYIDSKEVQFRDAMDSARHGVGMVHQEFMLFDELTVLENIIMGCEHLRGKIFIDWENSRKAVLRICEQYHFNIPLDSRIYQLPASILQQVEIVKVLYKGAEIIILDEPTSVLTPQGVEGLFTAIRFLINLGKTVIFITHKLKEVFAISDRITVLKQGRVTGNISPTEVTERQLANLMVGREVILQAKKIPSRVGETLLKVENLTVKDNRGISRLKGVRFDVRCGEILGIAGVAGSGQQYLSEAIIGLRMLEKGSRIIFKGEDITNLSLRNRKRMGIGYVPQNRMDLGVNALSTVWENCIMGYHVVHGFSSKIWLKMCEVFSISQRVVNEYSVKVQSLNDTVSSLSGGNIQRLIVGREFIQENALLIIEDPTRGIDVGAIEFVWKKIIEIAASGVGVLLISHELNEIMQLSDRIHVMYNGHLLDGGMHGELDEKELGILMTIEGEAFDE